MNKGEIIKRCCEIIECDTARISKPDDTMYLIIGFIRNTRDDKKSVWTKNGESYNFEYTEEKLIASGKTEEELIKDVKRYKRLCEMSWAEYFKKEA